MLWLGIAATVGANVADGVGFGLLGAFISAWPARADRGRTWLFDPSGSRSSRSSVVGTAGGMTTVEAAHRTASHFVLTVAYTARCDLWRPAAQELLCALLLAAATSARPLRHGSRWRDETGSPAPAELLDAAGFRALASSLRGAQHGAPENRDGIYGGYCREEEVVGLRWPGARCLFPGSAAPVLDVGLDKPADR